LAGCESSTFLYSIDKRTHCDEMGMLSRTRFVAAYAIATGERQARDRATA
jgi:hypothetical protein